MSDIFGKWDKYRFECGKVPPNGNSRGKGFESPIILIESPIFMTLSKKEQRSTTENTQNNLAKI